MARVKVVCKTHNEHTPKQVWMGQVSDLTRYQDIRYHIVFDVKIEFTRKVQIIAGRKTTEAPFSVT